MKTIALIIAATSIILVGQYANLRLKKRVSSIKKFIVLLEHINAQVSFSKKDIAQILHEIVSVGDIKLKTMCELSEFNDGNFHKNWESTIEKYSHFDCLSKEDINILVSYGKNLGTTDLQGQINNSKLHIKMLEKELKLAEEDLNGRLKINSALSSSLALGLIIILY